MTLKVRNTGHDSVDVNVDGVTRTLTVNSISIINGKNSYDVPTVAVNSAELNYCKNSGIVPKTPLIQMIYRAFNTEEIKSSTKLEELTKKYRELKNQFKDSLIDFHFQHPKDVKLTSKERNNLLELQSNADSTIISDHESNRDQSAEKFEQEILVTKDKYEKSTVSPTVDIGIEKENLFAEKTDKILDNGFVRFNVIYRSIKENFVNWIDLSEKIAKRNIWVNVVGVSPRWYNRHERISQMSKVFLFGVHSASQGYPWISKSKVDSYVLNRHTLHFEKNTDIEYDESRALSVNSIGRVLQNSIPYIKKKEFFGRYVPSLDGLNYSFTDLLQG